MEQCLKNTLRNWPGWACFAIWLPGAGLALELYTLLPWLCLPLGLLLVGASRRIYGIMLLAAGVFGLSLLLQTKPLLAPVELYQSQNFVGKVEVLKVQHLATKTRLEVSLGSQHLRLGFREHCDLEPGQTLLLRAKSMELRRPTTPGTFDYPQWLSQNGLSGHWNAECSEVQILAQNFWDPQLWMFRSREALASHLNHLYTPPTAGLLRGMLLGDASFLDPSLNQAFRSTGLAHILAISGFHIALIVIVLQVVLGFWIRDRRILYLSVLVLVCLYGPLTGNSAAVQRAVLFFAIHGMPILWGRRSPALHSLAWTAALLLLWDPRNLLDLGFQLSLAASLALLWINFLGQLAAQSTSHSPGTQLWKTWLWEPLYTGFAASLATAPLLIHTFHQIQPGALLGNLYAVPASTLLMASGAVSLILSLILSALGELPTSLTFLMLKPWVYSTEFLYQMLDFSVNALADYKWTRWNFGNPGTPSLWCLGLLPLALSLLPYWPALRWICVALGLGVLVPPWLQSIQSSLQPRVEFWVLDVGQGDALALRTPENHWYLWDAGPASAFGDQGLRTVLPFLQSQGVDRIHGLFVTHTDLDHVGGAKSLIQALRIDTLYTNPMDISAQDSLWQSTVQAAQQHETAVKPLHAGQLWHLSKDLRLEWLHPHPNARYTESNHASLVTRLCAQEHCILLTGDLEEAGERDLLASGYDLQADLLKIGHHGSRHATSEELLQSVGAQWALISAGYKNRYKHPHIEVLQRLHKHGIAALQTSQCGTQKWTLHLSTPQNPTWLSPVVTALSTQLPSNTKNQWVGTCPTPP